jgi:NAD-dependent deacetylase
MVPESDLDGRGRALERARLLLAGARRVAVLTGAGVSAESGVPTFRGEGGLWRGERAEDLATPGAFARDPVRVWEFYRWRVESLRDIHPNEGHRALARLEARCERFWLLTQNVDGLHQAAGSEAVVELHGSLRRARCSRCARSCPMEEALASASDGCGPPLCPDCGAPLRPDVVWFGEILPEAALRAVETALGSCDLMLVAGTSAVVQPAASFALRVRSRRVPLLEVNPEETPLTPLVDVHLDGTSARTLPALLDPA